MDSTPSPELAEAEQLLALAERCEKASGTDRDLDGDIAEQVLGWTYARLGGDCDGQNACEILTPDGKLLGNGFTYPPRGRVHRSYHAPSYTGDLADALRFAGANVALLTPITPRSVTAAALRARAAQEAE